MAHRDSATVGFFVPLTQSKVAFWRWHAIRGWHIDVEACRIYLKVQLGGKLSFVYTTTSAAVKQLPAPKGRVAEAEW